MSFSYMNQMRLLFFLNCKSFRIIIVVERMFPLLEKCYIIFTIFIKSMTECTYNDEIPINHLSLAVKLIQNIRRRGVENFFL